MGVTVTSDELLTIIGSKEVQLLKLQEQMRQLQADYTDIKSQLEARDAATTTVDRP